MVPGLERSAGEGISCPLQYSWAFLCGLAGKESTFSMGDLGLIPGLGRSPGERKDYPFQYSGLENFIDYSPWSCKESDTIERLSFSHSLTPGNQFVFYVCNYSCFVDKFICTIFVDSTRTQYHIFVFDFLHSF